MENPELFFAFVGPAGIDFDSVFITFKTALEQMRYSVEQIRLSELLRDFPILGPFTERPEDERIRTYMRAGTRLRKRLKHGDAVVRLGIGAIRKRRSEITGSDEPRPIASRHAFVLRSLKHQDEVKTLRRIYGARFYLIAINAGRDVLVRSLASKIAASHYSAQSEPFRSTAETLINIDHAESEEKDYGQNVRETFPLADVFVDAGNGTKLESAIKRFLELVFNHPFHTPNREEYGMYHAQAAALRSASLGRQVGAAIARPNGDVIAVGTNEVPRPGGGLYWSDDPIDRRDHTWGFDISDRLKERALAELLQALKDAEWLSTQTSSTVDDLVKEAMRKDSAVKAKSTRLMNAIEYMRAVHGEMAALINAAQRGVSVEGCTLYCTTFPCHDCAKHLLAAGIVRVVYLEPYPKSLVSDLFPEEIRIAGGSGAPDAIDFEPFVGVAPRKYIDLFTMPKRKLDDGTIVKWIPGTPKELEYPLSFYLDREAAVLMETEGIIKLKEEKDGPELAGPGI